MEYESDMLGVTRKVAKYVVHLSKKKILKKYLSFQRMPKQQTIGFCSQGILESYTR
jgi:hypothetical protein